MDPNYALGLRVGQTPFDDLLNSQRQTGPFSQPPDESGVPTPPPQSGGSLFLHTLPGGEHFYAPDPPFAGAQPVSAAQAPVSGVPQEIAQVGEGVPQAQPAAPGSQLPGGEVAPKGGTPESDIDQMLAKLDREEQTQNLGAVRNFFAAVNNQIAEVAGVPGQVVSNVFAATGLEGLTGAKAGLPTADTWRKLMSQLGIDTTHAEDTISGKFGKESVNSAIMLASMFAAVPYLAGQQGTNAVTTVTREIAKALQKHPWLATFTDPAATFGGVVAEHATGSPGMALPGAIAGGFVGSLGARAVMAPIQTARRFMEAQAQQMANRAMPSTAGRQPGQPSTAFRDTFVSPEEATMRVQTYAENQIEGELQRVQIEMGRAIDNVLRPEIGTVRRGPNRGAPIIGTGPEVQERLAQQFDRAEEIARKIEDRFWRRLPLGTKVPVSDLQARVFELEKDIMQRGSLSSLPEKQLDELKTVLAPKRDAAGRVMPQEVSVEKLRAIRGSIRVARKTEQMSLRAAREPNSKLIANMIDLEKWIDDAIADGFPDKANVALQQARNYSIKMHDLFDRGPVGDLLARRNRGDWNFAPEKFVSDLMQRYKGLESAVNISRTLSAMKNPAPGKFHTGGLAYPTAATPGEVAELKQMEQSMEDAIRTMFRDQADSLGPEGATKFIAKHENSIRPLAKVHAEMMHTFANLTRLQEERRLITESALNRAVGSDGRVAITRLFTDKNPAGFAKKLLHGESTVDSTGRTFRTDGIMNDPLAYEGLKNGVIDEFFARTKVDPIRSQMMLNDPAIKRMMQTVLLPDEFTRLTRMVDIAAKIEKGDVQSIKQKLLPGSLILAKVIGANVGGMWSRVLGNSSGGSLQTAAIFSQAAQTSVRNALSGLDARTLLAKAVTDPKWEKILYSKDPQTPAQVAALTKIVRRTVAGMEGLRNSMTEDE